MKNMYIDALFMGILLCILISLSFLGPTLIAKAAKNSSTNSSESPAFMEADEASTKKSIFDEFPSMTQEEKNVIARESHEKYGDLVDAMLTLRGKGFFTNDEILKIHKFIGDSEVNSTTEIPYTDKDLLEYLYDNNMITKAQYNEILNLMDEKD